MHCFLRLPQTPAVRVPRHKERVYSISVNGSPIAAGNEDIVINVPIGNGEVSPPASTLPPPSRRNPDEVWCLNCCFCRASSCSPVRWTRWICLCWTTRRWGASACCRYPPPPPTSFFIIPTSTSPLSVLLAEPPHQPVRDSAVMRTVCIRVVYWRPHLSFLRTDPPTAKSHVFSVLWMWICSKLFILKCSYSFFFILFSLLTFSINASVVKVHEPFICTNIKHSDCSFDTSDVWMWPFFVLLNFLYVLFIIFCSPTPHIWSPGHDIKKKIFP